MCPQIAISIATQIRNPFSREEICEYYVDGRSVLGLHRLIVL